MNRFDVCSAVTFALRLPPGRSARQRTAVPCFAVILLVLAGGAVAVHAEPPPADTSQVSPSTLDSLSAPEHPAPTAVPAPTPAPAAAAESLPRIPGGLPAWTQSGPVPDSLVLPTVTGPDGAQRHALEIALLAAGYTRWSTFRLGDSARVVVCPLEQVDSEGRPAADRWSTKCEEHSSNAFAAVWGSVTGLFGSGPRCRLRSFVFVLGPAAIARGSTAADVGSIERLAADTSGTPSLAAEPATSRCTVLVYCFELKPGQDVAKFSSHGGPSAIRHLAAAGVWPEAKLEPR